MSSDNHSLSLDQQFTHFFNHGWHFIIKPAVGGSWRTETNYPLEPRSLWQVYRNEQSIVGLRFGPQTNYTLLDIDADSPYHPDNNPNLFKEVLFALESIGLCKPLVIRSSDSGGIHVYYFLSQKVPSFWLAATVKQCLINHGLEIKQGQLEQFPNAKPYSKVKATDYNGHRLPLQLGSFVLDDDLGFLTDDLERFLKLARDTAASQDTEMLIDAIQFTQLNHRQTKQYGAGHKGEVWRQTLEQIINQGWTGSSQTNYLLQKMVCHGIVFLGLAGEDLIKHVTNLARKTKGFLDHCRHKHEIETRARDWVEITERNNFYSPYRSHPNRLATYAEVANQAQNNIVRTNQVNERRKQEAQSRLKEAVASSGDLPDRVCLRAKELIKIMKEQFGVRMSNKTLYKPEYLAVWHPKHNQDRVVNVDTTSITDDLEQSIQGENSTSDQPLRSPEVALTGGLSEISPTPPLYEGVCAGVSLAAPQGPSEASPSNAIQGGAGGISDRPPADLVKRTRALLEAHKKAHEDYLGIVRSLDRKLSPEAASFWKEFCRYAALWDTNLPELVAEAEVWVTAHPTVSINEDGLYHDGPDYHDPMTPYDF